MLDSNIDLTCATLQLAVNLVFNCSAVHLVFNDTASVATLLIHLVWLQFYFWEDEC